MAHTFEKLVQMQRTADQAHATVRALRDQDDPPTFEAAWQAWRGLAEDVQAAVTEHAKEQGKMRGGVELEVKREARHGEPAKS
ncbi:hypothetical protein ACIRG4_35170 [Streptomyces sp. NPDC102395]|uniref:hypothetical protein n=1 Tax=Streptomyces sp. NPDC102395 TaxID=3366168 RepID=UPI003821D66C